MCTCIYTALFENIGVVNVMAVCSVYTERTKACAKTVVVRDFVNTKSKRASASFARERAYASTAVFGQDAEIVTVQIFASTKE